MRSFRRPRTGLPGTPGTRGPGPGERVPRGARRGTSRLRARGGDHARRLVAEDDRVGAVAADETVDVRSAHRRGPDAEQHLAGAGFGRRDVAVGEHAPTFEHGGLHWMALPAAVTAARRSKVGRRPRDSAR